MAPSDNPYRCSFPNCVASFETAAQLKRHKVSDPNHEYCQICDVDFKDEKAFLVHKLEETEKHIACPICGDNFRSEGGRDFHFEQMHSAKQQITCVGCGERFVRAGGLMAHIEKNWCKKITPDKFRSFRAHKELVRDFLADPEAYHARHAAEQEAAFKLAGGSAQAPGEPSEFGTRSEISSVSGGIRLGEPSLLDDPISDNGSIKAPDISPLVPRNPFPKLKTVEYREGPLDDLLTGTGVTGVKDPDAPWGGESSATLFPDAPPNPVLPTGTASEVDARLEFEERMHPWDPHSKNFIASNFLHPVTKKYCCPRPGCGASLATLDGFRQHLDSPAHRGERITCPSCLRVFNNTTALVQHCESAANRCYIRHRDDFNQALDTITGGLIEVRGYHDDGTLKFDASKTLW
ncbi:MAG: hypothetical protein M1825_003282 [Sarcosagium campestre]|nr:MAG: hypothetical protein M1825_003282 [Sarcosagium campestre]